MASAAPGLCLTPHLRRPPRPVCLCSQVPACTSASNDCGRTSAGSGPCCVTCCSTSTTAERASSGSASRRQCECVIGQLLKSPPPPGDDDPDHHTAGETDNAGAHSAFNWKISVILNCFFFSSGGFFYFFFWVGTKLI